MYNEYVFTDTTRIVQIAPHKLNNTDIGARHTILYIYNKSNSYKNPLINFFYVDSNLNHHLEDSPER